jgi:hypothetical protein
MSKMPIFMIKWDNMRNANLIKRLDEFTNGLKVGRVYRASELAPFSSSLGRDLRLLVENKKLRLVGKGLYVRPDRLGDFEIPPDTREVISKFLGTNNFILRSRSDYNSLGLGLTQMFNEVFVYNKKRFGKIELDGKIYFFKRRDFPRNNHFEYLFVDLFNNIDSVGADKKILIERFEYAWRKRAWDCNYEVIYKFSQKYGKNWVKKYFQKL